MPATTEAGAFNHFEAVGWAAKAAAYPSWWGTITAQVVPRLLSAARVGAGARVLDVATGPGYAAQGAAELGASVVGIDIAQAMIDMARESYPALEFHVADAHALPFAAATFDAVVGNFALLHLGSPERALSECARVLVPRGRLAVTVWDAPSRSRVSGVFLDAAAEAGAVLPARIPVGPDYSRFAADAELIGLLEAQGVTDVTVETIRFTATVPSADAFWNEGLAGAVRLSALILSQTAAMQRAVRAAFDRQVRPLVHGDHLEVPVGVRLASGTVGPAPRAPFGALEADKPSVDD